MRSIIYDTETGEIKRSMSGSVPIEKQNLKETEAILTEEDADLSGSLKAQVVDTSADPPELVEDTEYSAPYNPRDWAEDRKAGTFSSDTEALDRLAEALR